MTYKSQKDLYKDIYQKDEYTLTDLPDYKITDDENISRNKIAVLGAGAGRDVKYLVKNNEVWGLDNSTQAVKVLKRIGIKAVNADLDKPLESKSTYFDIVVAKDILEHLDDPSVLADEIHRILKPGGYVVINVPNHFFLPMRLRLLFGKNLVWKTIDHDHTKLFNEWNYMHKVFFTWGGFKKFLNVHKFKIIKEFWDFGTLNHYSQPEMVLTKLESDKKYKNKKLLLHGLRVLWGVFNVIFPKNLRSAVVGLSPSLACASFYVWCKPTKK